MPTPLELAEFLMRKIEPIREIKIRTVVISRELAKLDDDQALEVLNAIIQGGARRLPVYQLALKSLRDLPELIKHIGYRKMSGIYTLSQERGYEEITRMLQAIPPRRRAEDATEEIYMDHELRDVELGMKKSLGRLGNRDLVNRLLHDQDPSVIEQILTNPGLTEDQVVRIAAKRPTSDKVLRRISESPKWISRYRIQRSLAFNPYTPTEISVRIVASLMRQDLIEIANDTGLHVELRRAAKALVRRQSRRRRDDKEQ